MRSVLFGALLMLVPAQAQAASWFMIGGNEKTISYVDLDSLRPLGGKIIAVTESVYASLMNDQIRATSIRSEYDCSGGYFRTLEYRYYDASGNLIGTEASETINEHKVPAKNSINESMMNFVCYRKGGVAASDLFSDALRRFNGK